MSTDRPSPPTPHRLRSNLLHEAGTTFHLYLKRLLREYRLLHSSGVASGELAIRAGNDLPRGLRRDSVYQASGRLIEEVWKLREKIGETSTPIRDLNLLEPDWRRRMPLEIEDRTSRALLDHLVDEAFKYRRGDVGELQHALALDEPERSAALDGVVSRLAGQPLAAEWDLVFSHLRLVTEPAATLALLAQLIKRPEAAATALIRAPREDFELLWEQLETLPFSWRLIPVRAWVRAAGIHRRALIGKLRGIPGARRMADNEIAAFLDRAGVHQGFFLPLADSIRIEVLGRPITETELRTPLTLLGDVLRGERQALLQRNYGQRWPDGESTVSWFREHGSGFSRTLSPLWQVAEELPRFRRPVLLAPVLTALASLYALPVEAGRLQELRRLRSFDPRWFDIAHEYALRMSLGILVDEAPGILR